MLKFIRGKAQPQSADRLKLQRELFAFNKTVHHGFPNKPTALAWDPELRLIAVANSAGALKVFGEPGVEFYGQHHTDGGVTRLLFLPNQGRLVSLCDDNSLHLWEINDGSLEEIKSQVFEGKLKRISAMCLEAEGELLLLGTEGGNVYFLNLHNFEMLDTIIYLDIVMQNVSPTYKITNPGAVEAIAQQPGSPNQFLIGYTRGLIALWDRANPSTKKTFVNTQQLESLCWDTAGQKFVSSHNDGSYAFWDLNVEDRPCEEPTTLYGPFPCKPVTKLIWRQTDMKELLIFSGGMPRASYSDKFTVTVHGKTHVVLDFTSKVIDFLYMEDSIGDILLVLTEEELVAVDLKNEEMKMIELPYLSSIHASAVTCSFHACGVSDSLYCTIKEAGKKQKEELYSERNWPQLGGVLLEDETSSVAGRELLLTGHEDGTVRFWDCSGVALTPLYKFSSAPLFANEEPASPIDDEEEWPPFKKIGTFDPYSDDPRLAIKKVWLCPTTGTLVAAGTAGYAVILQLSDSSRETAVQVTKVNIVSDRDNFVWKGHDPLTAVSSSLTKKQEPGLQLAGLVQLHPPAGVSAMACSPNLGLLALGTAHGLGLVDFINARTVLTKCTLNPNDISGAGDAPISRRKSFKKSLRESFRRLRKGRSTARGARGGGAGGGGGAAATETRPVERAIEARPTDDGLGSVVRCIHIASTFLVSLQTTTPTFWAGTNNGTVYAFTINMPPVAKRREADVTSMLGKEIQLKHRAPVLNVTVVDSTGCPVTQSSPPLHRVLIVSEEQVKIFTLPSLKPLCKLKLTAHEGCLVRKAAFATFATADKRMSDTCLLCLTNFGDVLILSVPELRRYMNAAVIPPEDINGITSLTFTQMGEAFYLHSSSEFQRLSLAATKVTKARCKLALPESARLQQNGVDDEDTSEEEDETSGDSEKESDTPMANGSVAPGKDSGQNGVEEDRHDISVGDITVDSVKDHLISSNHSITETVSETKTVMKTIISETITTPPKITLDLIPNLTSTPASSQTSIDGAAPLAQVEDVEN